MSKEEILNKWLAQCFETGTLHFDTIGKIHEAMEEYKNQTPVQEQPGDISTLIGDEKKVCGYTCGCTSVEQCKFQNKTMEDLTVKEFVDNLPINREKAANNFKSIGDEKVSDEEIEKELTRKISLSMVTNKYKTPLSKNDLAIMMVDIPKASEACVSIAKSFAEEKVKRAMENKSLDNKNNDDLKYKLQVILNTTIYAEPRQPFEMADKCVEKIIELFNSPSIGVQGNEDEQRENKILHDCITELYNLDNNEVVDVLKIYLDKIKKLKPLPVKDSSKLDSFIHRLQEENLRLQLQLKKLNSPLQGNVEDYKLLYQSASKSLEEKLDWCTKYQEEITKLKAQGNVWVKASESIDRLPLEKFMHLKDNVGCKRLGNFFKYGDEIKFSVCGTEMYESFIINQSGLWTMYWLDDESPLNKEEGEQNNSKEDK